MANICNNQLTFYGPKEQVNAIVAIWTATPLGDSFGEDTTVPALVAPGRAHYEFTSRWSTPYREYVRMSLDYPQVTFAVSWMDREAPSGGRLVVRDAITTFPKDTRDPLPEGADWEESAMHEWKLLTTHDAWIADMLEERRQRERKLEEQRKSMRVAIPPDGDGADLPF